MIRTIQWIVVSVVVVLSVLVSGLSAQGQGRRYSDYAARSYTARYFIYQGDTIDLAGKSIYNWAAVRSVWTDSGALGDLGGWTTGGESVAIGATIVSEDTSYFECYFSLDNIPTSGAFLRSSVYIDSLILSYFNGLAVAGDGRTDTVCLVDSQVCVGHARRKRAL